MDNRKYEDILAPRRGECSNFMWASRHINPQIAFKQERSPSPQDHKEEVFKSAKIQELLLRLSQKRNVAKECLEEQVIKILEEIGYNKKLKVIRWLGMVLVKICAKICNGIYVNEDRIVELKSLMGGCPIIFVPSHRSYADFILMSLMCFTEDLAIPAIAAGMDFHGMRGMGGMLRNTGAFFMRRSYNDDSLYWTTFKQYVYQIITKGELPLEFFIEGTRSRSNKSLSPKYGLILMILKAFFLAQVPDILFVPINISYDRVLEEKLFAFELLGIPKPKETTSGFFKSLSILKENYGSIYFTFGKAISVKEFFGPNLDRSVHALQPIHQQEITENEKKLIPALAYEIVYQQQKHHTITAFNLLAIVLYNNLTSGNNFLGTNDLIEEVLWLKKVTENLGGHVHMTDPETNILEALEVHKNIVQINEHGKINLVSDKIVLDKLNVNKLKAHELSEKTLTFSVPFIMLQIYINPVLHYFVDVAILVVVLKHYTTVSFDELFQHYRFLRGLLSQEFITFSTREKMEFEKALQHAINMDLIAKTSEGGYDLAKNKKLEVVMFNCIDNFIFCYFIICSQLTKIHPSIVDEKSIMARVQEEIEIRINEKSAFIHPYSLSLDTISNCLTVLSGQGVLRKIRNKGVITYELNKAATFSLRNRLVNYIDPDQERQRTLENVHLHLKTKL